MPGSTRTRRFFALGWGVPNKGRKRFSTSSVFSRMPSLSINSACFFACGVVGLSRCCQSICFCRSFHRGMPGRSRYGFFSELANSPGSGSTSAPPSPMRACTVAGASCSMPPRCGGGGPTVVDAWVTYCAPSVPDCACTARFHSGVRKLGPCPNADGHSTIAGFTPLGPQGRLIFAHCDAGTTRRVSSPPISWMAAGMPASVSSAVRRCEYITLRVVLA